MTDKKFSLGIIGARGYTGTELIKLVAGHPDATHALAVGADQVAASVASLECHQAYLADLPWHPKPADFIPEILRTGGKAAGHEFAVTLRAYDLG